MKEINKILSMLIIASSTFVTCSKAMECEQPPKTEIRNYQGKFDISAAKIVAVRGPSLSASIKTEAKSLLENIPNADKALVDLNYLYSLCTALRDDVSLAERDKARLIAFYGKTLRVQPASVVKVPTFSQNKPNSNAPEKSNIQSEKASTFINGNTAPVLNGNNVGGNIILTTPSK